MITVRRAGESDLPELVRLYRLLEGEMVDLHEMWPVADGLPEPIEETLRARAVTTLVYLGGIDGVPFGFLTARLIPLHPQGGPEQIGMIDLIFTEPAARGVGIAEAMAERALEDLGGAGARRFDARVLPGHRQAKNFFERTGFSARSITMHRRAR